MQYLIPSCQHEVDNIHMSLEVHPTHMIFFLYIHLMTTVINAFKNKSNISEIGGCCTGMSNQVLN